MSVRVEHIGEATLYLGDCREILPTLGGVDAVVTDPPYGISADKAKAHSSIRDNPAWARAGWDAGRPPAALVRALADYPQVAIWGGNYFADLLAPSAGWLVWRKPEAETGFSLADVELCWTNRPFAARTKTCPRRDGNDHPTQKPVSIMQWTLSFIAGEMVLDPFMGSGTTGVACVNVGRKFIGIEIEPKYFDIACRRIDEATRQPNLFIAAPVRPSQQRLFDPDLDSLLSYNAAVAAIGDRVKAGGEVPPFFQATATAPGDPGSGSNTVSTHKINGLSDD